MESTNVLVAIKNLYNIRERVLSLGKDNSRNRINSVGESLEGFIKDLFCDSLNETKDKHKIHAKFFSYLGTKYSLPDIILNNSDAILVISTLNLNDSIRLYSPYPEDRLYADSTSVHEECRSCESWVDKDYLYIVGNIEGDKLLSLWFVYGDCCFASREYYKKLTTSTTDTLDFSAFNFSRCCHIKHPIELINHTELSSKAAFVNVIMLKEKYLSFPANDRAYIETSTDKGYYVDDLLIHSPNNPDTMLNAKLISYQPIH